MEGACRLIDVGNGDSSRSRSLQTRAREVADDLGTAEEGLVAGGITLIKNEDVRFDRGAECDPTTTDFGVL